MASKILITASELEIYDHLERDEGATADEVASHYGGTRRAFSIFLNALAALGVIGKEGELYRNTPLGKRHLVTTSPHYLGDGMRFRSTLWDNWAKMESILRGEPLERHDLYEDEERNRLFISAMHAYHFDEGKEVAELLELQRVRNLLDLGGGAASFSIAFCLAAPDLKVELIDLPPTLEVARQYVEDHGMSERITLKAGDFYHDPACDLGGPYDMVFISHILHMEGEEYNLELLSKVVAATAPAGRIVVNEVPIEDNLMEPVWGALFAVNMLTATERGDSYPQRTIAAWLSDAGCSRVDFLTEALTVGHISP
jgi:predicted O-methyltransferase YrrM